MNDTPQVDFEDPFNGNRPSTADLEKNQRQSFANDSFIELIKMDAIAEEEKRN